MGTIKINENCYSGNNISVINGKVYIDGKLQTEATGSKVEVVVTGDIRELKCDGSAVVNGNVLGNVDCGGSCHCGNVGGFVDAGGSVICGNVNGDVDAGGSVHMTK